ncbi:hypothetical protein P4597_19305 [Peribacillus simplex]|uniref:hypothetical protein n=1 Tax=Peribacillus simplex TaxID=1478 RepID=UPI002E1D7D7A|nr:hypothetical protein [Peribacillus simplex]
MIANLIEEGKNLESEAKESGFGVSKFFDSVSFEKWVAKSILYLETYQSKSIITEKAKSQYKTLNNNTNYSYYKFLLGSLEASKEVEDYKKELEEKQADEFTF